jgi:hypothetical protein
MADRNSYFSRNFRTRWNTLRQPDGLLSDSAMDARIDALTAGLAAAASRNFTKWNILNTQYVPAPWFKTPQTTTWPEQLPLMKTWLHDRAAWLDEQWLRSGTYLLRIGNRFLYYGEYRRRSAGGVRVTTQQIIVRNSISCALGV